jgi:DNA repair protein RadA/Sms
MSGSVKSQFVCENCGAVYPKWQGQCGQCKEWNTLVETLVEKPKASLNSRNRQVLYENGAELIVSAKSVADKLEKQPPRLATNLYEIDRVFGGGFVAGSVSLVGGQPGIGKSTILTQLIIEILINNDNLEVIYVAGEESPAQIVPRIQRIIKASAKEKKIKVESNNVLSRLQIVTTTDVDQVINLVSQNRPALLVIDSVQTMFTTDLTGIAGSVGQLRESASRLVALAKRQNIPTFLVGHVTKEGDIAGPKVLEHIVDTVIEVSGDRTGELRVIRSLKNRFGPTDEVGLLKLTSGGIEQVTNPAEVFIEGKTLGQPGSALTVCLEGSRPIIVEVQALAVSSPLSMPRRVARGLPISKLHLLLAVLQKYARISFEHQDVFVNVIGEVNFKDPAMDLAVAAALISAKKGKAPEEKVVYCGEIGLLGEVRQVRQLEKRVKEAKRLGYKNIVTSKSLNSVRQL